MMPVLLITLLLMLRREVFPFAFVTGMEGVVLFLEAGVLFLLRTLLVVVEEVPLLLMAEVELLCRVVVVALVVDCVDSHRGCLWCGGGTLRQCKRVSSW